MSSPPGFSLSAIAIRRHIGTLVLTLAAVVLGIYFFLGLQVDLLPSITYPRIGVRLNVPGVAPEVAVEEVTKPLEEALGRTEGVQQIYSQTREGQVSLDLFFEPGGNIDQALNDATATFNRARGTLPDTIEQPRLFKVDPSQSPIYELGLTSPSLPGQKLRLFADEDLSRELSVVPGVASVDIIGGAAEEVQVVVDLPRMQALGVGLTNVLQTLEQRNQDVAGGRFTGDETEPLARTVGKFREAQEIENVAFNVSSTSPSSTSGSTSGSTNRVTGVSSNNSQTSSQRVYLRDFAQVIDGSEEQRLFVSLNGSPAVRVSISKQPEANTVEVIDRVEKRLAELKQTGLVPPDLEIQPVYDESRFIRSSLTSVIEAALSGAGLAALVVFIFLGSLRKTLIISLTIPLCTLAAAAAMKFSGFSLNIFSLAGLAISVGQAVDTSVVILENIDQRATQAGSFHPSEDVELPDSVEPEIDSPNGSELPNGLAGTSNGLAETTNSEVDEVDARQSYRQRTRQMNALVTTSSREVESSLVAATAANLVSVMPFVLIGGFISLLFNELIWTICFAVAASLLVALTVVPVLAARLMAIPWSSNVGNFWPLQQFNRRFSDATHLYRRALAWVLPRRLLFVLVTLLLLGGSSWWLVGQVPQELLPRTNTGQVSVIANFPPGTSLANNRKVMSAVEDIVQRQPETSATFFTSGGSLFGGGTSRNPLRSNGTIVLKPDSDIDAYIAKATKAVQRLNLAGIRVRINRGQVRGINFNNSPLRSADVDVVLRGNQPRLLARTGRELLQVLEDNVTLANFRPDADARQPEVQVIPDWERVTALGLNAQQIGETVQTAIQGFVPTQLQRGDRLVDVRVQLAAADRQRPGQLAQLPLFSTGNPAVRLGDVAEISWGEAPGDIQRINQQQVFMIAGNLNQGANLSKAIKQVEAAVAQVELPSGITLLPSAAAQSNRQIQDSVVLLGLLATFLVFVVLAVQYNSLLDPLVIMLTVPLALTGSFLGLYVTQTALGATVIVGAVLLVGIVVNNAILLLELANEIVETEHCSRFDAILKAAPQRLRPIMMTLITTILGIFPLALGLGEGSEFLRPLGIVVFWGMSGATFLTLFLIPCFYVMIHGLDPLQRQKQKPKNVQKAEVNVG